MQQSKAALSALEVTSFLLISCISANALSGFTLMIWPIASSFSAGSCRPSAQDEHSSAVMTVELINLIRLIGFIFVNVEKGRSTSKLLIKWSNTSVVWRLAAPYLLSDPDCAFSVILLRIQYEHIISGFFRKIQSHVIANVCVDRCMVIYVSVFINDI